MAELLSMCNIGREMERKLRSVGICSAEELALLGSKTAFARLKAHYPNVCLVHLYALQGAVEGVTYNLLPEAVKQDLKRFCDCLK